MLSAIFALVGAQAIDDVTMEDLAMALPIVIIAGAGLIYWMNKAYKKDQSR